MAGDGGPLTDPPGRARRRRDQARLTRPGHVALAVGLAVVAVAVLAGADFLLVNGRIDHVHVVFPQGGTGSTTVIIGSDTRAELPSGASRAAFGTVAQVPDQQADVVLVIHTVGDRTSLLSIPRDTLVSVSPGNVERLTLAMADGPQGVVDGLCRTLGITADHLVVVDFRGFADIVDQLGGITVDLPHPVRDPVASLDLPTAGTVRLDGLQALALVRSRNPQWKVDGAWVPEPDGGAQRTGWAGQVLSSILRGAQGVGFDPFKLQSLAWTASNSLTTDQGTQVADLVGLARIHGSVHALSEEPLVNLLALEPDAASFRALAAAGYGRTCTAA